MLTASCYSSHSQYYFTFFCSFSWRLTESVCSTNALSIAMHRQTRTLFLFTYAKISHVSVRTYPSQIQYRRYRSSSFYASQRLAQLPRRGPVPKLLWADLFINGCCIVSVSRAVVMVFLTKSYIVCKHYAQTMFHSVKQCDQIRSFYECGHWGRWDRTWKSIILRQYHHHRHQRNHHHHAKIYTAPITQKNRT